MAKYINWNELTPKYLGLNNFESFRPQQIEILKKVIEGIEDGERFFVISAPTGVGKSLVGVSLGLLLSGRTYIITSTKHLQKQYCSDFPFIPLLKGRSNYTCKTTKLTCEYCVRKFKVPCEFVDSCEYNVAKAEVEKSRLAIFNTAYYLSVMNYTDFLEPDIAIFDEAHLLENALMNFIELRLSRKRIEELGFRWMKRGENELDYLLELFKDVKKKYVSIDIDVEDKEEMDYYLKLEKLFKKLYFIREIINENWVFERNDNSLVMKPIFVRDYNRYLFHSDVNILMSATISSEWVKSALGVEDFTYIEVDSPFKKERRMIVPICRRNLAYRHLEKNWNYVVDACKLILRKHINERGLILVSSFNLAWKLYSDLKEFKDRLIISEDKEDALRMLEKKNNGVLIGANLFEGVDLKGDLCRFIVFVNLPFASLSDLQVKKRAEVDKDWYILNMVNKLIQGVGRGVRSEDDYCITYILDSRFKYYLNEFSNFFPRWFREAVVRV